MVDSTVSVDRDTGGVTVVTDSVVTSVVCRCDVIKPVCIVVGLLVATPSDVFCAAWLGLVIPALSWVIDRVSVETSMLDSAMGVSALVVLENSVPVLTATPSVSVVKTCVELFVGPTVSTDDKVVVFDASVVFTGCVELPVGLTVSIDDKVVLFDAHVVFSGSATVVVVVVVAAAVDDEFAEAPTEVSASVDQLEGTELANSKPCDEAISLPLDGMSVDSVSAFSDVASVSAPVTSDNIGLLISVWPAVLPAIS